MTKHIFFIFAVLLYTRAIAQNTLDENPFELHKAMFLNKPAPDFKMIDAQTGSVAELSSFKGKVLILNFWFINCSGCQVEYPGLQTLRSRFKTQNDVAFVSVALDDPEKLKEYLRKRPLNFSTVSGDGDDIARGLYRAIGFPMNLIIDREGIVRHIKYGGSRQSADDIEYEMLQLLKDVR